jgi:class 3 adenylate cyclase/tetratricopeptide (TPR) repeat protein
VECPDCGFASPAAMQFCGQCGTRLPAVCPSCGHANPATFRFCGRCGKGLEAAGAAAPPALPSEGRVEAAPKGYTPAHLAARILRNRSAIEGERKQVTVLFADVAGFTSFAETLDPEIVHGVMDRCFRILMDEVHRYEGTINQFTGDGIMALFGAPLALEDAPERAVRAALGIQSAVRRFGEEIALERGLPFRMRIGIHAGPVVVGKIGDDLRMDYTAVGDTTNLASRLQASAEPGAVLVSDHVARLIGEAFVTRPLGPLALKGKKEPVLAHEVLRLRARRPFVVSSDQGLTPYVGRDRELATLEGVFEQVVAGRGQMAFVVGDAGIGKSRLVYEFRRRLAERDVTWLEGRCVSFAREMPLLPVIDVVKSSFAIEESDGEATIIDKVRQGVQALGLEPSATVPYLRALLTLDPGDASVEKLDANARRFEIFGAMKRLTLASAARRPLVVQIEDLHWIDQPSEEYLGFIADALATARVLLLCTYRPGYRSSLAERSYSTRLALQPLSADDTSTMAEALLEAHAFPDEIRELIAQKAEGNPFFIEEVAKSLLEIDALRRTPEGLVLTRELSEIVIPDTIQEVIMARIDRLADGPKRAIQIASVIGRDFAARLLKRVADVGDRLDTLVGELRALELIYEKAGVPELAYMFKHALTHEVAYESLLLQRRKELHRIIGSAIEELYGDRLAEHCETLAHHFFHGEDWPRALEYLVKAGDKAAGTFANAEAAYFYQRAIEAAAHIAGAEQRLGPVYEAKGNADYAMSDFAGAIESFRVAARLATLDADRLRLKAAETQALIWGHEFDSALRVAEETIVLGRSLGDVGKTCDGIFAIAMVNAVRGKLDEAERTLTETAPIAVSAGALGAAAHIQTFRAMIRNWRGDYRAAIVDYDDLIATLREQKAFVDLAQIYSHYTIVLGGIGDYGRALEETVDAIALSEAIGDRIWLARQWNTRGWILGELGAFEEAEEANRRCIEIARRMTSSMVPELIGNAEANLADLALWRGDLAGAEPHLAAVAALLADPRNEWMVWRYGMHHHATASELAVARGEHGRAREHLAACLSAAERTRSRRYLVRARRALGRARLASGEGVAAAELLGTVAADARVLGNPVQLWETLLAHGRALHALGRKDDAAEVWREGLALAESVRQRLPEDVGARFRGSPNFAAIAECVS